MKIAIVGSGIAGLAAAHRLKDHAQVTLFEAGDYFGGHTHTVDVTLNGEHGPVTHGVDTGFLVFNERTYPQLIALLAELGVPSAKSDMSFSVQVPGHAGQAPLEWSGSSLNTVFSQRANLLKPRFWGMLRDLLRFNRLANELAQQGDDAALMQPLADFLTAHRFSAEFRDWYLLPMLGCIWSCPIDQMLQFPTATMIRFCHNHGLIQVSNRPQWWTVPSGARQYVDKIIAGIADKRLKTPVQRIERDAQGVHLHSAGQTEHFDKLVLACHSDQALALLATPTRPELAVLGAIGYQPNRAVLHTDTSVLPQSRRAWAAWNYERAGTCPAPQAPGVSDNRVCLHYLLNQLQPLPFAQPVVVSLNPLRPIDPTLIHGSFDYAHPVFDLAAIRAQAQVPALQGQQHTYFCGAWTGYGFHEDGLKSGLDVARRLLHANP
ncbi:MAG: FAD-dependent oxidoreductase [Rhodoferax sp.]|uniref:NAD(P)/FAD-dependent oxidoreductase n=1 Tax=Rhodoferax sp. TaxID=50421 RepID=UPI001B792190|nr:FAD-dependent oxidoreductase [Rhodoferax sp.]MBP9905955.1 FAD-dependent oxidoreductase [Rhodoferax sp.]